MGQWHSTPWCIFVPLPPPAWYVQWHPLISQAFIPGSDSLCNGYFSAPQVSLCRWVGKQRDEMVLRLTSWGLAVGRDDQRKKWGEKKKTQKKRHAFDFWYELQTERGFHQGYKHKNQDDERQMRGNTHITAWWNKDYMHGKKKPNKYADQLHVKCFEQGQVAFRLSIPITIILCLKSQ